MSTVAATMSKALLVESRNVNRHLQNNIDQRRATQGGLKVRGMILRGSANATSRTVQIALSSEEQVDRGSYIEVLDHSPGSVDLSRLQNSAPLLVNHNTDDVAGVIEKAWLDSDRKCRCQVRFGNSARANEIFKDVQDGIRVHASVGYEHTKELSSARDKATGKEVVRFAWRPYEVSSVPIPADTTVGVGRGLQIRDGKPEPEDADAWCDDCQWSGTWRETSEEHKCPRCGKKAVSEAYPKGRSISPAEFEAELQKLRRTKYNRMQNKEAKTRLLGLTEADAQEFSIVRAIRDTIQGDGPQGFEREMLEEGRKAFPTMIEGQIWIPPDLLVGVNRSEPLFRDRRDRRDLSVGTATAGGNFVQTTVMTPIVEILRNKMITQRAGVQMLAGLQGHVAIPRQTGAATAYVLSEQAAITKSTQVINQIAMTPRRVGGWNSYTKQLLLQSSVDVENFVRDDLMKVLGIKMDYLLLQGNGGAEPLGIKYTSGIGAVTFGTTTTYEKAISFETALALANADIGRMAYVTSPDVRAKWKVVPKIAASVYPVFIWESSTKWPDADGEVNNYRAFSTNQMDASRVAFGNFEDAVMGMWGGLDILVDPYTNASTATINVTVNAFIDVAVRHAASFAWSTDSGAQ